MAYLLITLFLLVSGVLGLVLFAVIHLSLNAVCIRFVRRYCRKHELPFTHWRIMPGRSADGAKQEYSLVDVAWEEEKSWKVLQFQVWPFGIIRVGEIEELNTLP